MGIPESIEYFFLTIVLAVVAFFVLGIRAGVPGDTKLTLWTARAGLGALAWLALTGQIAHEGWLRNFDTLPPNIMILFFVSMILTCTLAFSRLGLRLIDGAGPVWLVAFQVFRVPVEIFLHDLYEGGFAPVQMTYAGLNFDIFSGLTAPAMAWLVWRGRAGRPLLLIWNVFCLFLLVNIVSIAVLSFPTPFRVFSNEPANIFVTYPPFIWLPTVLVQAALLGHLLVFRWLWLQRKMGQ